MLQNATTRTLHQPTNQPLMFTQFNLFLIACWPCNFTKMRSICQLSIVLSVFVLCQVTLCSCDIQLSALTNVRNSIPRHRFLEDGQPNDGDNYNGDLSAFTITQGHCFRMKIENNNDDDGNEYFYNGAYRSQYKRYISYLMCMTGTSTCHEYVVELNEYLEQTVPFVQNWCAACASSCRRQLHGYRDLEDADGMNVDCSTCANDCKMLNSDKGNSGNDESDYIGCQAAANDGDGMQYYTAPQCENDHIVIGRFYDDECTIKTTTSADSGFSYNTFATIERMNIPCKADNSNTCRELYENNVASCENGVADNADEDQNSNSICKAAAASGRVYTYYKKPLFKKTPIVLLVVAVFALGFLVGFLSYTYYVRHRRAAMIPLASLDGAPSTPGALPALS